YGSDSLEGKTVAIQGVGNVAYALCEFLHEEGAKLIVTDINKQSVERAVEAFNATAVDPDDIYDVDCDIYAPCALGATVNDDTINRLKAKIIAGSANNQLKSSKHGDIIHEKGIVYAPDYVINSGGVINVADELVGYNQKRAMKKVETIYDSLTRVFEISRTDNIPTYVAADRMAEERIEAKRNSRSQFLLNDHHILSRR
ncbi:leucine dehydrogenase, partial [Halomonas sp. MG34]|nr:leucine dehydrogenase [Halomonas sp. MG34]